MGVAWVCTLCRWRETCHRTHQLLDRMQRNLGYGPNGTAQPPAASQPGDTQSAAAQPTATQLAAANGVVASGN